MANGLAIVSSHRDVLDAQAAVAKLDSEGIECSLANEYFVGVAWNNSTAVGWVQVQVAPELEAAASAALAADESAFLVEIDGEFPAPGPDDTCPRCGSESLKIIRWSRYALALMLLVPLPLFIFGTRIKCRNCGKLWKPGVG